MEAAPRGYAADAHPESGKERARLNKRVRQINTMQKHAYDFAARHLDAEAPQQQMLCVVIGKAGTGKSRVLRAVQQLWRYQHGAASVALVAQTNAAAHLIDG